MKIFFLFFFLAVSSIEVFAQTNKQKDQLMYMNTFGAGQAGVNIYKLYDVADDVICYLLMPEVAGRKATETGAVIFEGNGVGSISCVKTKFVYLKPSAESKK